MSGPASDARVSVIIPSYNCGPYLPASIDSILAQTRPPAEILVIDDGSSDNTSEVVGRYGDKVAYIQQANTGVSAARNRGLGSASGDLIALMDADDVCDPGRLEVQARALASAPAAVGCFTGHWVFDDAGRRHGEATGGPGGGDGPMDLPAAVRALTYAVPLPPTLMFRRSIRPGERFPLGVSMGEDVLFCALLRTRGPFVHIPTPLYGYRARPGSASRTQTQVRSFEQRLNWMLDNRERYCPDCSEAEVREKLWDGLAELAETLYWTRQRRAFLDVRAHLRAHWPPGRARPRAADWRWYPDWAWRAKGWADRIRRRKKG